MDCGRDNKVFRPLNVIHLSLVEASYDIVLRNSRISDRMFRVWISRFNAQGPRTYLQAPPTLPGSVMVAIGFLRADSSGIP